MEGEKKMKKKLQISKLDAAKRQLEMAIKLYFNYCDPVSIHTLACAAYEILLDLSDKYGGIPMILSGYIMKEEQRKVFCRELRKPQNFFKHGKEDYKDSIVFNPDLTQYHIFDACTKYMEITGEKPIYLIAFIGWFLADNLKIFISNEFISNIEGEVRRINETYKGDRLQYFRDTVAVGVGISVTSKTDSP